MTLQFRARLTIADNGEWFDVMGFCDDYIFTRENIFEDYIKRAGLVLDNEIGEIYNPITDNSVLYNYDDGWYNIYENYELQQYINNEWVTIEMGEK